jgi:hypothetical protein
VDLIQSDEENVVVPLKADDYQLKIFNSFSLTKECLTTKDKLECFLNDQKQKGNLSFREIKVIDFRESVNNILNDYDKEPIELISRNYLQYNILGRIYTVIEDRRLRRENAKTKANRSTIPPDKLP